jgi:hypothetical protein
MNDTLTRLADMPKQVRALAEAFRGDVRRRPEPDAFSVLENVCHLRDIERLGYTERITRMLGESDPELADVDGARVAREADYNATEELAPALDALASLRAANVAALSRMTAEEWERTGLLEGAGRITIRELTRRMEEHDRGHVEELARFAQ